MCLIKQALSNFSLHIQRLGLLSYYADVHSMHTIDNASSFSAEWYKLTDKTNGSDFQPIFHSIQPVTTHH